MRNTVLVIFLVAAAASPGWAQIMLSRGLTIIDGNGVLEANETAVVSPAWGNAGFPSIPDAIAALTSFTGPAGPTYSIVDGAGRYSLMANSAPGTCTDCYVVRIDAATRPAQHWDTTMLEGPLGIQDPESLHIGATFDDVPSTSAFYRTIETLVHRNVTAGCAPSQYCPTGLVGRDAMAVFLLVAMEPRGYAPPACGAAAMFADVPVSSPFCRWVEELARRGTVGGCGGGLYCPSAAVSRAEMAVFLLAGSGPTPPACTTAPFLDVPVSSPFCRWIRELTQQGVTAGCGNGNYCPDAPVTREQMSAFLTSRFALELYAPDQD